MIPHFNANPWKYLDGLRDGDLFYYHHIEFVKLGEEQGGILCAATRCWGTSIFDTHQTPSWDPSAAWPFSAVRDKLYKEFLQLIDEDDLLEMTLDLTPVTLDLSQRGDKEKIKEGVGILSLDQCKKYKRVMPKYGRAIWTCSPHYENPECFCISYPDGSAGFCHGLSSFIGYAPVLLFRKEKRTMFDENILFDI